MISYAQQLRRIEMIRCLREGDSVRYLIGDSPTTHWHLAEKHIIHLFGCSYVSWRSNKAGTASNDLQIAQCVNRSL